MERSRTGQFYTANVTRNRAVPLSVVSPAVQLIKKTRMHRVPYIPKEKRQDFITRRVIERKSDIRLASLCDDAGVMCGIDISGNPIHYTPHNWRRSSKRNPHDSFHLQIEGSSLDHALPQEIAPNNNTGSPRHYSKGHVISIIDLGICDSADSPREASLTLESSRDLQHPHVSLCSSECSKTVTPRSRDNVIEEACNTYHTQSQKGKSKIQSELSRNWHFFPKMQVNRKKTQLDTMKRESERIFLERDMYTGGSLSLSASDNAGRKIPQNGNSIPSVTEKNKKDSYKSGFGNNINKRETDVEVLISNYMKYSNRQPPRQGLEDYNTVSDPLEKKTVNLLVAGNAKENKENRCTSVVSMSGTILTPTLDYSLPDIRHQHAGEQSYTNTTSLVELSPPYDDLPLIIYRPHSSLLREQQDEELSQEEKLRRRIERERQGSAVPVPSSQEDEKICWSMNGPIGNRLSRESRDSSTSSVNAMRHLQPPYRANTPFTTFTQNYTESRKQAESRISPTRRKGRIIMIDRFNGLLFDEDIKMPIPFDIGVDGTHLSTTFDISDEVMYNICHESGGVSGDGLGERGRTAVRIMTITSRDKHGSTSTTQESSMDCHSKHREKCDSNIPYSLIRTDGRSVTFLQKENDNEDDINESRLGDTEVSKHTPLNRATRTSHPSHGPDSGSGIMFLPSISPLPVALTPTVTNNLAEIEIKSLFERLKTLLPNDIMPLETLLDNWNDSRECEEYNTPINTSNPRLTNNDTSSSQQLSCCSSPSVSDHLLPSTSALTTLNNNTGLGLPTGVAMEHIAGFGLEYYTILQRIRGEMAIAMATGEGMSVSCVGPDDSTSSFNSTTSTINASTSDPIVRPLYIDDTNNREGEGTTNSPIMVSSRTSESREREVLTQMNRYIHKRTGTSAGLAEVFFTGQVDPYFDCSDASGGGNVINNISSSANTKEGTCRKSNNAPRCHIEYSRSVFDQVTEPRASQKVIDLFLSSNNTKTSKKKKRIGIKEKSVFSESLISSDENELFQEALPVNVSELGKKIKEKKTDNGK